MIFSKNKAGLPNKSSTRKHETTWANVKDEPQGCLAPKAVPQPTCQAGALAVAPGSAQLLFFFSMY
jgi:hypothetical protein